MATPKLIPRANGEGSLGAATYGWGAGFITDATATSSTQGGSLTLAANDGAAAMGSGHRLGVIEFKGEEDASNTLTTGARIESVQSKLGTLVITTQNYLLSQLTQTQHYLKK